MSEARSLESEQHALMQLVVARDREALGKLYDLIITPLFSLALRFLENHQEAEDITQEVFVQIWQKADQFDPQTGSVLQWTVGIMRNRCIDRLRAHQRQIRVLVPAAQLPDQPATDSAAESKGSEWTGEELQHIRAAVATLPADQRQTLELAFFGGLSHHEIAEHLKQPLGTIKARIRRGMMRLRENLEAYL